MQSQVTRTVASAICAGTSIEGNSEDAGAGAGDVDVSVGVCCIRENKEVIWRPVRKHNSNTHAVTASAHTLQETCQSALSMCGTRYGAGNHSRKNQYKRGEVGEHDGTTMKRWQAQVYAQLRGLQFNCIP